jgi:hypothetical protein
MQPFHFTFPLPQNDPQPIQRWQADGSLAPSKLYLINRPYPYREDTIARLVDEGHYLVGSCAFENWPARIHNPHDRAAARAFDLFIEPSYHRFIGFMHNFRDPHDVFPGGVPLLDMDFSDYVQVRKRGQAKTFDMVYYAGYSIEGQANTVRWSSVIKGHELALMVIRALLEVDPNFRVAIVNDVFSIDHPRVKNLGFLPYRTFLDLVESAHVLLVPSTVDASPRVITEALCLDTYVMMNADISGGWKYVNEQTGAFFDQTNFLDVYTRLRARGPAATRGWFLSNYANHTLEARFNGWLHASILRHCAFNRFGGVLYVCLEGDRREERQAMIRGELFRHMGIFGDCVEQVPAASVPGNPHKARGLSHLAALQRARDLGLPDVVIFEDDFQFIVPRQVANRKIEALLRDFPVSDAILFGNHQITRHEVTSGGAVLRVRAGAWPHGYAVRAERYDELITGLAEACAAMPDAAAEGAPLVDDVWTRFAERANVHAFRVPLGEGTERIGKLGSSPVSTSASGVEGSLPQGRGDDLDARRQSPPQPRGIMKDPWLTIVIAVRNEASNLWFTLQGLGFQDLDGVEIVVANNGGAQQAEVESVTKGFGAPARHILADSVASVNFPRSAGAEAAGGEWLLFLDAHVLLSPGAIGSLRDRAREGLYPPLSLVHIPLLRNNRTGAMGHYRLTLEQDFWGKWGPPVRETDLPYRIAATGNYAMLTRRQDFEAARGFNPRFAGYGGDEIYIQLKYWRLGGEVLLEPLVRGAHYSGPRSYQSTVVEVVRNIGLAGRVVVGPDFLQRFEAKISPHWAKYTGPEGVSAALRAGVRAAEESGEAAWLGETAKLSFDEVLDLWRREGVPVA